MSQTKTISIRLIASIAVVVLISITVFAMAAISERHARNMLTSEIEARLFLIARNVALISAEALFDDYPELVLAPLIKDLKTERPELAFVVVTDSQGRIKGHADTAQLDRQYGMSHLRGSTKHRSHLRSGEVLYESTDFLVAKAPVIVAEGEVVGETIVGMHRGYLQDQVRTARRSQIPVFIALLCIGIAASILMVGWLLRPLDALRHGLQRIGQGRLDSPLEVRDRTELGLLAQTVNEMSSRLRKAQAEMVEKERLNHEMALAQDIQMSLRPPEEMVTGEFVLRGMQRAAAEVGGDYSDILHLPDGRIGLAVADVAGKGLAGCLTTAMLAALVRAYRAFIFSPKHLLAAVDHQLKQSLPRGTFVTMFYGILDPQTGTLNIASAGHGPSLVYRRNTRRTDWYHPRGAPLAAVRSKPQSNKIEETQLHLDAGDMLVQFTDGINEAWKRGNRRAQFGLSRVEALVAEHAHKGASQVIGQLKSAMDAWIGHYPRSDDETILIISREGSPCEDVRPRSAAEQLKDLKEVNLVKLLVKEKKYGSCLSLAGSREELSRIGHWIEGHRLASLLSPSQLVLVYKAIYELCANIIEHGTLELSSHIDVFWFPSVAKTGDMDSCFVVCDHGSAFDPRRSRDGFDTAEIVRKDGRGIGLPLIHRVMSEVYYSPSTAIGNITLLILESTKCVDANEVSDV